MENHFKLLAAFAGLLVLSSPAAAAKFTGAGIFASDSGGSTNLLYWNTRGGDLSFNLYLKQGGGWLNSGNGAGASINIPLGLGSRTYLIFGQTGLAAQTYVGMNLFFEGDDDTPLISGLMATNTYSPLGLNVIPNSSGSTRTLRGNALVAGANTLEFTAVGLTVELAAFSWYTPASAPAAGDTQTAAIGNYVGAYNNAPDALNAKDYRGYFTLLVTPEPASICLLGAGLGVMGGATLRRRRR